MRISYSESGNLNRVLIIGVIFVVVMLPLANANPMTYNSFLKNWSVFGPFEAKDIVGKNPQEIADQLAEWFLNRGETSQLAASIPDQDVGNGVLNFGALFGRSCNSSIAIALAEVNVDFATKAVLSVGVDEVAVAFVNGVRVMECFGNGEVFMDSTQQEISLQAGKNLIVLVSYNSKQSWGAIARFLPCNPNFELEMRYHKIPLPAGVPLLPDAVVTYMNQDKVPVSTTTVSAARTKSNEARYVIKDHVVAVPAHIAVNIAVPYLGRNYSKTFDIAEVHNAAVGSDGDISVFGIIVDKETSAPVKGVAVSLVDCSGCSAVSDSNGRFIIDDVDPAFSVLQLEVDGYRTEYYDFDWTMREGLFIPVSPL